MESNKTPTTTDLLGSVEKSKNTPVTMTAEKAVNEHERLIDTLKHPTGSSLKREIKEQESELCGYKNKLKRQFKKSSLIKGAMRRLAPWNKEARQTTANMQEDLGDWQENANRTSRKNLIHQKIDDSSRKRTLHKLSSLTPTKVHPDGKRSFLLHRGMDIGEYKRAKIKRPQGLAFQHHEESSWTPNLTISGGFASDAGRDLGTPEGAHVSAWIHEDNIALMPNQHSQNSQSDQYKYEHEVIVKPRGISPLVRRDEVAKLTGVDKDDKYSHPGGKILDNPDRMINFRQQNQNQFGGDPVARNKYILPEFKRNRFKKSQLAKSPIIHEQEDDFTYKTLDDNAFNEHFHEMVHEESLPNGLIHHIYQEKNSPDGIIHALSQGDPSRPVSLIAGYIEHKGPYKGYNAHLTATAPEHQGQGHGTLLKELATKRHGRMVSDATLSPAEDRSWQKLKRPDINVKFGQRFVGDIEAHPDDANEAAQDAHIATYKKPLAASEFKKSSLIKGAARRLFPFNPEKDIDEMDEESIARWQRLAPPTWEPEGNEEAPSQKEIENQLREDVPEFKGPAQKRSLLKLHSKTQSRRNPDTGKVEYLLHRGYGKGGEETIWHDHDNKISKIPQRTSWTPQKSVADQFGIRQKGQSVSAWIPEDHIVNVPKQYGIVSVMPEKDRRVRTENKYADEHEVIVSPGTFLHGTSAVQPTIDTEITRRGSSSYPTEPADIKSYAKKRGRFQKSSIFSK